MENSITVEDKNASSKRRWTHNMFTVGWVCVLKEELNAARFMLDEEYERLLAAEMDDNNYILGRMGNHNVVIAFSPEETHSTNAASHTGMNLLRSFPNIRLGLLVGVGGGAPGPPDHEDPLTDMRLGDVVVSTPKGRYGGVIPLDIGKCKGDEDFRIKSHLNKPPTILTKATQFLQSDHDFGEGQMINYINDVATKAEKSPQLKNYCFPGREQDQLFSSAQPNKGDSVWLIERPDRGFDDPVIHYGLIASGDPAMQSSEHRDRLREELGVICFESQAARLMDDFPCIVIRGICDYSDEHKNKAWQPYAAVTAAAYAKDLLRIIEPQEVRGIPAAAKIIEILEGVQEQLQQGFKKATSAIENFLGEQERKKRDEILNWLSPVEYSLQQTEFFRRRTPGTGQLLLHSREYLHWLKNPGQALYCRGAPGAGKTILTSIVVEHLYNQFGNSSPTVGVAYIYLDYRQIQNQRIEATLSNLLKQLARTLVPLPDVVCDIYKRHAWDRGKPSVDTLESALHVVAHAHSRVFIIIDALDECQSSDGYLTKLLSTLLGLQKAEGVNVFTTSRYIPTIRGQVPGSLMDVRAQDSDIRKYVGGQMGQLPSFVWHNEKLIDEIYTAVVDNAQGVFSHVSLYCNSLVGERSPKALRNTLRKLSTGSEAHDDAYELEMQRIQGQHKKKASLALDVLAWITCAIRPLTKREMQIALAVDPDTGEIEYDNVPSIKDIISVCAGLVTVDEDIDAIVLFHRPMESYLRRNQQRWFPDAKTHIANVCIAYLLFTDHQAEYYSSDPTMKERLKEEEFYCYAMQNWHDHALQAQTASPLSLVTEYGHASHDGTKTSCQQAQLHLTSGRGHQHPVQLLLGHAKVDPNFKEDLKPTSCAFAKQKSQIRIAPGAAD